MNTSIKALLQQIQEVRTKKNEPVISHDEVFIFLSEWIEDNIEQDITWQDLTDISKHSVNELNQIFVSRIHLSPMQFIRNTRKDYLAKQEEASGFNEVDDIRFLLFKPPSNDEVDLN